MKKLIFLVFGCLLLILNGITLQFPVWFFTNYNIQDRILEYFNKVAEKNGWYYE